MLPRMVTIQKKYFSDGGYLWIKEPNKKITVYNKTLDAWPQRA